jgi:hypothetical protein
LRRIVETVAQTWWTIQRRRSRFGANVSTQLDGQWEWQATDINEDDIRIAAQPILATDFASDDATLVVFPRVFVVDEERDAPVFPGVVRRRRPLLETGRRNESGHRVPWWKGRRPQGQPALGG